MNTNKCIVGLVVLFGLSSACAAKHPNIVVIVADDMGWGDSATFGHELIQTPDIDKLAAQGVKLTQCYSAQLVAAEALHWLKDLRDPAKPFALSVWMHEPHFAQSRVDGTVEAPRREKAGLFRCHHRWR